MHVQQARCFSFLKAALVELERLSLPSWKFKHISLAYCLGLSRPEANSFIRGNCKAELEGPVPIGS